jgi:hypothetical protein
MAGTFLFMKEVILAFGCLEEEWTQMKAFNKQQLENAKKKQV